MRSWLLVALLAGCGGSHAPGDASVVVDMGSSADMLGDAGDLSTLGDAATPTCVMPSSPQSCAPPSGSTLPVCTLALTGCMDATHPTQMTPSAHYYEVNSPLWSDGADKTRGFVLPSGGTIHVKDCTSPSAECTAPNGTPNGTPDTGRWVFPVGTVMIKNFGFDGKVLETRLLMRVDAATALLFGNANDWVGFTYQWNEAQTEATLVPDARTPVQFDTGMRTVPWTYPNRYDCIDCHAAAVGTLGPETAQMNRVVGTANQIDTFIAAGLFDTTAPQMPYTAPLVDPKAGGAPETSARSYLSANCGFCHRPDVRDLGFDLRWQQTFKDTKLCGAMAFVPIGSDSGPALVFAPGNHAQSSMWVRMNTPVAPTDPKESINVGRMPPVATYDVDQAAVDVLATWIDGTSSCP